MISNIILILIIVLAVALAGLFAGAETGIYQLSRLRLRLGVEKKQLSFIVLAKAIHDSPALLLTTLIATNLTHYLATSIVTYIFLSKLEFENTAELFAMLVTTPILFIFAELIPKNIFFHRADSLMPFLSPFLLLSQKFFTLCGIVPLLKYISGLFTRLTSSPFPSNDIITNSQRHQIDALLLETQEEGIFSTMQTDIINQIVMISNIHISTVMTPLSKVRTVNVCSSNSALLNILNNCTYTRLLVYEDNSSNIMGFINIYDCLTSTKQFTDLHSFIKPISKLPLNTTVSDVIDFMQSEKQKIILVTKTSHTGREKPVGIVTMKDLVEELLGELAEW